jgi:sterol desaturase/sphingolipid hydroxylase (fatty acid hydroxylase superfamily)
MCWYDKETLPDTYLNEQMQAIRVNYFLLGMMQSLWDFGTTLGVSKTTMGNTDPLSIFRDCCLWMLCFEITWYTQHRLMHDVKFLWNLGHSYHHGWKRPEHMIGVTNFAFDHIVEIWVTMSSSFIGYIIFPANFYVGKVISFAYMILAVLVHWDGFGLSRYHLNHHYLVTKNYGSHIPIFDIFFGTYQWEPYYHKDSIYGKRLKEKAAIKKGD